MFLPVCKSKQRGIWLILFSFFLYTKNYLLSILSEPCFPHGNLQAFLRPSRLLLFSGHRLVVGGSASLLVPGRLPVCQQWTAVHTSPASVPLVGTFPRGFARSQVVSGSSPCLVHAAGALVSHIWVVCFHHLLVGGWSDVVFLPTRVSLYPFSLFFRWVECLFIFLKAIECPFLSSLSCPLKKKLEPLVFFFSVVY